jgi:hypothetical protein
MSFNIPIQINLIFTKSSILFSLIGFSKHIAPSSPLQNYTLCEHKESTFWNGQVLQTSPLHGQKENVSLHTVQAHDILHEMFPWNGSFPCLAHLWIHRLSLLLLALAMPMSLGLTHHDCDKQEGHHKKVADRQIFHYHLCKAFTFSQERRQTKGRQGRIVHAPTGILGQKWQRTQVGKKSIPVHNEVRQRTSIGPGSFLFGEVGDIGFLLFSVCSQCVLTFFQSRSEWVPNMFIMFPVVPYFIQYPSP